MRYRLERLVAHGGMASVWVATDEQLRRPVAVKLLHEHLKDPISLERFRGEGKLAAQISHPGIVAIYDTFHDRGIDGIVLEYIAGTTLRERLDTAAPLEVSETIRVAANVSAALCEAHQRGLVHRDVKPGNILLGPRDTVKVTDFGIAKLLDSADLTQPGTFVGTAKYLAPEQVMGNEVDGRADVYSLGIVIYEMLTGRTPFAGETDTAIALARLHQAAPPVSSQRNDLPPRLAQLVNRMLDKSPMARPSMAEVSDLFAAADFGVGGTTRTMAGTAPKRRWVTQHVSLLVVSAVVVASLGLAAALISQTRAGQGLWDHITNASDPPAAITMPIALDTATFAAFDPDGDDVEHDELLPFLHDLDPTSVWTTETYKSRTFGEIKDGLGIIIDLKTPQTVSEIRVMGASTGWNAAVYIANGAPDEIDTWGSALGRHDNIEDTNTFSFAPVTGRTILLWITDLGDPLQVSIGEIDVRRPA